MRLFNFAVGTAIAAATVGLWALANRPNAEPPWPEQVAGMSFSPLRVGNDPAQGLYPTVEQIDEDLALLQGKVRSIRTYGVGGTLAEIPRLAKARGMKVTVGGWLSSNLEDNEREITQLVAVVKANKNVTRVVVGNEAILRGELTAEQMIGYLERVKKALKKVQVTTAEPWHVWLKYPELVGHVSFIAAHFLPYWEGVHLNAAVDHVVATHNQLKAAFPKTPIVLAEVGWPSNGRTRKSSVASEAAEATFLRRFLDRARAEKYDYYLMEAFDQPWKTESEGAVGAYWGVYDLYRSPKFAFTEPIVPIPRWHVLAGASVVLGILCLAMLLTDSHSLGRRGRGFLAVMANCVAVALVWVAYEYANQYLTAFTVSVGIVLAMGFLGITAVLLTEAHEMAEASWMPRRRRPFGAALPPTDDQPAYLPKVSVHVPAYNEPPDMMIDTLNALARLDYPDFEVLVIDNNTKDPAVWQPVEAHCATLGPRFRFFHVDPLKGFKAGALNYLMPRTAPDAEVIAVIDSDYQVSPSWLRDLVPHFAKAEIGIVQAPQDYRDEDESVFKDVCFAEYK
ncbi:MAG: glycoside hydrolase family 17 protein, partial [Deferrisomatales bacterium]